MQRGTLFLSFGQLYRLDETLGPLHCGKMLKRVPVVEGMHWAFPKTLLGLCHR